MSVDLGEVINRIPRDKLTEIVNSFTASTTGQQMLESLSALGIEASEEEAEALVASLLPKDGEGQNLFDDELKKIIGGQRVWYICPYCGH